MKAIGISMILALMLTAVGCGGSDSEPGTIVGTWISPAESIIIFGADGKVTHDGIGIGTYEVDGDDLIAHVFEQTFVSRFEVTATTLTIYDPDGTVFPYTRVAE